MSFIKETFDNEKVIVYNGDSNEVLAALDENSVDSIVTDPPYHLTSIVKRFGKDGSAPAKFGSDGAFSRASKGFMGQEWDGGDIAFTKEFWEQVYRVLKPGGHLVAFSASKNYHRMAVAIEDAGFEIRDQIMWLYGTGMPKSYNIKDKVEGYDGWGSSLKPAVEPICLARKPLSENTIVKNVLKWGTGAININATRVPVSDNDDPRLGGNGSWSTDKMAKNVYGEYEGKDVSSSPLGRWPANICTDGSDEVVSMFPNSNGALGTVDGQTSDNQIYGKRGARPRQEPRNDTGSAARFFYSAKATKEDRNGSKHPTVKPVSLMEWLVKMVTPIGGTVLDPFSGSGTTGKAAQNLGFNSILIEKDTTYFEDIKNRFIEEQTPLDEIM